MAGPLAHEFITGGGLADVIAANSSLAQNGFRQIVILCLKNPACARTIGAGSGVTVLGKIIEGEDPPGYVQIASEIKGGRYLYVDNFRRTAQEQFWNETKSLRNPVLFANDYRQFEGSTFYREVTDLMDSGWTIILNIMAYPPKQ